MKIYLPLIAIVMPLPALSIIDVNFTGSSLQWIGPYNNYPQNGEKPPLVNGCYGNTGYPGNYYCLTPGIRTYTPDVSFVSPDDPISLMSGKSCTINMDLRIKNENSSRNDPTVVSMGGWDYSRPIGGYTFKSFYKESSDCLRDLTTLKQWGTVRINLKASTTSSRPQGDVCMDLYVDNRSLVIDRDPWTCGQGGDVSPPTSSPQCEFVLPFIIDHGTLGKSVSDVQTITADVECDRRASISLYFVSSGTPMVAAPNGGVIMSLGEGINSELCLQSSTSPRCYGGTEPLKGIFDWDEFLIRSTVSTTNSASGGDYAGQVTLVANVN